MITIIPLNLRSASENLSVSEWLTLITLCLAPLAVHIIAGIPHAVYLQRELPKWHDEICFYNPTTILWRYLAITDRRVRSRDWNSIDMAATNARFWTNAGWIGSEDMMEKSRLLCTRSPLKARVAFVSRAAAETLIVILQGAQALFDMQNGFTGSWEVSLATAFYPLAIFGLLRLPAAYWLSEEGSYIDFHSQLRREFASNEARRWHLSRLEPQLRRQRNIAQLNHLMKKPCPVAPYTMYPTNNWRGWLVRLFFGSILLGCAMAATLMLTPVFPSEKVGEMTVTSFTETCFYCFLGLSMLVILAVCSFRGDKATTIIPCIGSIWYKVYTVILLIAMLVFVIVACLETRKTACGVYTTSTKFMPCRETTNQSQSLQFDRMRDQISSPAATTGTR